MLTKAIVEEVIDAYSVRVRVPRLDGISESISHVKTEDLHIATICTLPNCLLNVQPGDVVFVANEDNTERKLVVLGNLSRSSSLESYVDITTGDMTVLRSLLVSGDIELKDITYSELSTLKNIGGNIQKQIDLLEDKIQLLETQIEELSQSVSATKGDTQ